MEPSRQRRELEDLERQLLRQDPAFVRRMRAPLTAPRAFPALPALGVVLYILTPIVALLTGYRGLVILLTVAAAIVASRWWRRRSQRRARGIQ